MAGITSSLERFDAFQGSSVALKSSIYYYHYFSKLTYVRLQADPDIWIRVRNEYNLHKSEAYFFGAGLLQRNIRHIKAATGTTSVLYITSARLNGQNIDIQSANSLGMEVGAFEPSVKFIFPLNDYLSEFSEYSISFCLQYCFE